MSRRRAGRRIGDIMQWSPSCREHFFPWKSKAANAMQARAIAEAGVTECHPGYHLERSAPRFHLLVYPTEGMGLVFDALRSLEIKCGQLLIVPALHAFGYHPKSETWRFTWFHLPDNDVWSFLRRRSMTVRKTLLADALREVTEGFLRESRGRTNSHQEASALLIHLAGVYLQREFGTGETDVNADTGNRLDYLGSVVNKDLARDWTVETLADVLNVSRSHLHRMTQKQLGVSPMKLVTRWRMERAQELLILHDARQGVIGEMVGYQNEFAFLVAFKRFSGVTPKEFRKWR